MKNKVEILNDIYLYLYGKGKVISKTEFAEILEVNYTNLTSAFKGNERYLTKNLFKKINEIFGGVFSTDWIMSGDGDMIKELNEVPTKDIDNENNNLKNKIKEMQILIDDKEKTIAIMEKYIKSLERDNERLEKYQEGAVDAGAASNG